MTHARCLALLILPIGLFCSGCLTVASAQYAASDAKPYGWVDAEVRPAYWIDVAAATESSGPRLGVTMAVVKPFGDRAQTGSVLRYVVIELDENARPADAMALPNVAGMTPTTLAAWVDGLTDLERQTLRDQAKLLKGEVVAGRRRPEWVGDPPEAFYPHYQGGAGMAVVPESAIQNQPALADVVEVEPGVMIVAYRLRPNVTGAWPEGGLASAAMTPPPPPPDGLIPDPQPYHAAVALPATFRTSGADRTLRAAAGLVLVPTAIATDVGFSLLPLALTVAVVAAFL